MTTQISSTIAPITTKTQFESLITNGYAFNLKANALKVIEVWKQSTYQQIGFVISSAALALVFGNAFSSGDLLISILTTIFWASAFLNAHKITKGQPIKEEDWMSGKNHFWDLLVLGLKMILFVGLPVGLLFLVNLVAKEVGIVHPMLESSLTIIGSIWAIYFLTSCSLSILLMVVFELEDWDAIYTSRKLVHHHLGWFLLFNVFLMIPSYLGTIGIVLQFALINGIALLYYLVLTEAIKVEDIEEVE